MKKLLTFSFFLFSVLQISAQCAAVTTAAQLKTCLETAPYAATLAGNVALGGVTITIPDGVQASLELSTFNVTWTGSPWSMANPGTTTIFSVTKLGSGINVVKNSPDAGQITLSAFNALGSAAAALPIELREFTVATKDHSSLLSFSTTTEKNNAFFAIERSSDDRTFTQIGEVKGAGTSLTQQDYTYTDEKPLRGINFYRLKQVDFDGQFSYSPVVSVVFGKVGNVVLYPTPTTSTMNMRLEEAFQTEANWQIIDLMGRVVTEGIFPAEQTDMQIPVGTLSEGNYVLRVTAGQEVITQKFRKIEQ